MAHRMHESDSDERINRSNSAPSMNVKRHSTTEIKKMSKAELITYVGNLHVTIDANQSQDSLGVNESDIQVQILKELREMSIKVNTLMGLQTEVDLLKVKNCNLEQKVDSLVDTVAKQQSFIDYEFRRNRLVLSGVPETHNSDGESFVKDIFSACLEHPVDMTDVDELKRLGKRTDGKTRPLLVRFKRRQMRDEILKNAKKLRSAGNNLKKVYINPDLDKHTRMEQARLRKKMKELRAADGNAGKQIRIQGNKLFVDEVVIDQVESKFTSGTAQ